MNPVDPDWTLAYAPAPGGCGVSRGAVFCAGGLPEPPGAAAGSSVVVSSRSPYSRPPVSTATPVTAAATASTRRRRPTGGGVGAEAASVPFVTGTAGAAPPGARRSITVSGDTGAAGTGAAEGGLARVFWSSTSSSSASGRSPCSLARQRSRTGRSQSGTPSRSGGSWTSW